MSECDLWLWASALSSAMWAAIAVVERREARKWQERWKAESDRNWQVALSMMISELEKGEGKVK